MKSQLDSGYKKRLSFLEKAFEDHLIESGEIKADIKWLKKSVWAGITMGIAIIGAVMAKH